MKKSTALWLSIDLDAISLASWHSDDEHITTDEYQMVAYEGDINLAR